jgi:NAD(P)-dependent dehydrogenase (short-subunit alcohol dehydrogenase family)
VSRVHGVVTGAGGVLGGAVVAQLVSQGHRVVAVGRALADVRPLEDAHPGAVLGEAADLTDPDAVDELWQRLDSRSEPIDFLVNVAGGFGSGTLVESSPEDYRHLLGLNLDTAWWSCRAAARRMRESGGGAIVNVAARSALEGGAGSIAYAVTKAAVVKLTQVLAGELKQTGVRVNAVLPSLIDTPANRAAFSAERMAKAVAPEAIARVITFLCGEDAWPISGAAIPVYGRS